MGEPEKTRLREFAKWFFIAITEGADGLADIDPDEIEGDDLAAIEHWLNVWNTRAKSD